MPTFSRRQALGMTAGAAVVGILPQVAGAQAGPSTEIGGTLPDLRFVNPSRQWSSVGQLTPQTTVIYLWASWCPICQGDLRNIAAIRSALGGSAAKVTFLLLNFLEPFSVGYTWARVHGFDLPYSESDANDRSTPSISTASGTRFAFSSHTPQLYITDARRVIRWRNRGQANSQEMLVDTLKGFGV
jgi:hypothetical protein